MTKQRALLVSAIVGNGLLIFAPSASMLAWVWAQPNTLSDPLGALALFVLSIALLPLMLLSAWSLWCVRVALTQCGHKRNKAIELGQVLCVLLAFAGLLLSVFIYFPFPLLVIGGVAFVTGKVLSDVRAQSQRGFFCPQCDYDLIGLAGTKCPECGLQVKPEPGT